MFDPLTTGSTNRAHANPPDPFVPLYSVAALSDNPPSLVSLWVFFFIACDCQRVLEMKNKRLATFLSIFSIPNALVTNGLDAMVTNGLVSMVTLHFQLTVCFLLCCGI